jgi:hypothetical protein
MFGVEHVLGFGSSPERKVGRGLFNDFAKDQNPGELESCPTKQHARKRGRSSGHAGGECARGGVDCK